MKAFSSLDVLKEDANVRIVMLGPPGTGKGSLASMCERELGVKYVSTGQLFREEIKHHSSFGDQVDAFISKGQLVPDDLVIKVMLDRVVKPDLASGFILDGFPRTVAQAISLDDKLNECQTPLDGVLYIATPQEDLVRRLSGRLVCSECGESFHLRTMRPKVDGKCDHCSGELMIREDDQPETIRKRLEIDHENAAPLLKHYRKVKMLHRIDGRGHIEAVYENKLLPLLKEQGWTQS